MAPRLQGFCAGEGPNYKPLKSKEIEPNCQLKNLAILTLVGRLSLLHENLRHCSVRGCSVSYLLSHEISCKLAGMIDLANVHALSDFQRNAKKHIRRLKASGEPAVLTVNGQAEVVIQSAE